MNVLGSFKRLIRRIKSSDEAVLPSGPAAARDVRAPAVAQLPVPPSPEATTEALPPDPGLADTLDLAACDEPAGPDFVSIATYPAELRRPLEPCEPKLLDELSYLILDHFRRHVDHLPPFPTQTLELLELVRDPKVPIERIVALIEREPPLVVSLLRVANSALFARDREVTAVRDAIILVGLGEVAQLALAASVAASLQRVTLGADERFKQQAVHLLEVALTRAFAASWLSRELGRGDPDRSYLGGMIHDIGKILTLGTISVMSRRGDKGGDLDDDTLWAVLDALHIQVGTEAVAHWQLPRFLVSLTRWHHGPVPEPARTAELDLVRVSSGLLEIARNPNYPEKLEAEVLESLAALELEPSAALALFDRMAVSAVSRARAAASIQHGPRAHLSAPAVA